MLEGCSCRVQAPTHGGTMNSFFDFGSILSLEQLAHHWTVIRQWVMQNILVWENLVQVFMQIGVLLLIRLLGTLFGRRIRAFVRPRMKKIRFRAYADSFFTKTDPPYSPPAQHRVAMGGHLGISEVRIPLFPDAAHPEPFDRLGGHPAGDLGDSGPVSGPSCSQRSPGAVGRFEYRRVARRRHGHAGKGRFFPGRCPTEPLDGHQGGYHSHGSFCAFSNGRTVFLESKLSHISELTPSTRVLVGKIVNITMLVVVILVGLNSVGIDLTAFAVFSGAIGRRRRFRSAKKSWATSSVASFS